MSYVLVHVDVLSKVYRSTQATGLGSEEQLPILLIRRRLEQVYFAGGSDDWLLVEETGVD